METRTTKIYFRVGSYCGKPSCTAISHDDQANGTTLYDGYVDETLPYRDFEIGVTMPVLPSEAVATPAGHVTVTEAMVADAAAVTVTGGEPAPVS